MRNVEPSGWAWIDVAGGGAHAWSVTGGWKGRVQSWNKNDRRTRRRRLCSRKIPLAVPWKWVDGGRPGDK